MCLGLAALIVLKDKCKKLTSLKLMVLFLLSYTLQLSFLQHA